MEEKHHVRAFHERLNVLVKENIKKDFLQGLREATQDIEVNDLDS
jgi:hypothetical protein